MHIAPICRRALLVAVLLLVVVGVAPGSAMVTAAAQPTSVSYWGMNLYLTKRERLATGDNLGLLATSAQQAGVQWTREELPWDLIEPQNNTFRPVYDGSLKQTADAGFGIIGMLLTTPGWARDGACSGNYWCPPANVHEYAQFAGWMTERYDGDGVLDAPGSPRIAAWEIWNEPNAAETWPLLGSGGSASRQRYGEMLVAAYQAIKAADPSAIVLTGGVYVFDGSYCAPNNCDGLHFLGGVFQQVPAARTAFDVLAIHPYMPTERPDAPNIPRLITVEGRVRNSRSWLQSIGRGDARLWITEMGWCTAVGNCPGGVQVSEEQQANYLVRSMVVAQHNGVEHTSWFQFEDAFNDPNREWSNAAIVGHFNGSGYPAKLAYYAYRTLVEHLGGATVAGTGPVHTHVYDPAQPYSGGGGTYDYRYVRGTTTIDVLWRPTDSATVSFPLNGGQPVTLIQRGGARTTLQPSAGTVQVTVSESPILIVQGDVSPRLSVAPNPLTLLAETGTITSGSMYISNSGAGSMAWSAASTTPWLTLVSPNGTAPAALNLRADARGLGNGTYTGAVTITGSNNAGTMSVPVQLIVVTKLNRVYMAVARR